MKNKCVLSFSFGQKFKLKGGVDGRGGVVEKNRDSFSKILTRKSITNHYYDMQGFNLYKKNVVVLLQQCIPSRWICNGRKDCDNNWDEGADVNGSKFELFFFIFIIFLAKTRSTISRAKSAIS